MTPVTQLQIPPGTLVLMTFAALLACTNAPDSRRAATSTTRPDSVNPTRASSDTAQYENLVLLGDLVIPLDQNQTLDSAKQMLGTVPTRQTGDASTSEASICYRSVDPRGPLTVRLTSDEMGGGTIITGAVLSRPSAGLGTDPDCGELAGPVAIRFRGRPIDLLTTRSMVLERFGTPPEVSGDTLGYLIEGQVPGMYLDRQVLYDLVSQLNVGFQRDDVSWISAYKLRSY